MINIELLMPTYIRFLTNYLARGARNVSAFFNTRLMLNSLRLWYCHKYHLKFPVRNRKAGSVRGDGTHAEPRHLLLAREPVQII